MWSSECNQRAEAASTLEAFEKWDAHLHEAIAAAAHNAFIADTFRRMSEVRSQSEWGILKRAQRHPRAAASVPAGAPRPGCRAKAA